MDIYLLVHIMCQRFVAYLSGMYNQTMLNATIAIDGWIALTYMALLYELTRPGWITFRHITMAVIPFAIYCYIFLFQKKLIICPIIGFLVCFGIYITNSSYRHALKYSHICTNPLFKFRQHRHIMVKKTILVHHRRAAFVGVYIMD